MVTNTYSSNGVTIKTTGNASIDTSSGKPIINLDAPVKKPSSAAISNEITRRQNYIEQGIQSIQADPNLSEQKKAEETKQLTSQIKQLSAAQNYYSNNPQPMNRVTSGGVTQVQTNNSSSTLINNNLSGVNVNSQLGLNKDNGLYYKIDNSPYINGIRPEIMVRTGNTFTGTGKVLSVEDRQFFNRPTDIVLQPPVSNASIKRVGSKVSDTVMKPVSDVNTNVKNTFSELFANVASTAENRIGSSTFGTATKIISFDKSLYSSTREQKLQTGRNLYDLGQSYVIGAGTGYALGTVTAVPRVFNIVNKPTSKALLGSMFVGGEVVGFAASEDKQSFAASSFGGIAGGFPAFNAGFKEFNVINPNVKFKYTGTSDYRIKDVVTRENFNRLTLKDNLLFSGKVGERYVVKDLVPEEFKINYKITGNNIKGNRAVFVYKDKSIGIFDTFKAKNVFGKTSTITREFTSVTSKNSDVNTFNVKINQELSKGRINTLQEGFITTPITQQVFTVGKPTYEVLDLKQQGLKKDVGISKFDITSNLKDNSFINIKNDLPLSTEATRRGTRFSTSFLRQTRVEQRPNYNLKSIQEVNQKIKLEKPYVTRVTKEAGFRLTTKGTRLGIVESAQGQRAIGTFGSQTYINTIEPKGFGFVETKYPRQISETLKTQKINLNIKNQDINIPLKGTKFETVKQYNTPKFSEYQAPENFWLSLQTSAELKQINKPIEIQFRKEQLTPTGKFGSINYNQALPTSTGFKQMKFGLTNFNDLPKQNNIPSIKNNFKLSNTPINIQRPIQNNKVSNNFKFNINNKIDTSLKASPINKQKNKNNLIQQPFMQQMPELQQKQLQQLQTKQLQKQMIKNTNTFKNPRTPRINIPNIKPPINNPPSIGFNYGYTRGKSSVELPKFKTSTRKNVYTPSVEAAIFKIKTPKGVKLNKQQIESGLVFRPLRR